ncbi:MAG: PAS domain-containing protein [Alphaproteobacteria bacterium]|nr:PAS domain-containing protein [Alphaproteobacteria bacterium]
MPHLQPSALPLLDPSRYFAGDVALAFLIGAGIVGAFVAMLGFVALALVYGRGGTGERWFLSDAVEGICVGILAFDRRGRLAYANPIAKQSIPRSPEFLHRGQSFLDIMLALSRQGILDLTHEGVTAEAFARDAASDFRAGCFTRTMRTLDARVYRVEQRSAHRNRQILTIADITDLHRREAQLVDLNRQNRLMAIAIDAAPSALYVFNPTLPTNPIVLVNPAFLAMTGSKPCDVLGQSFDFHLADTTGGAERNALRAAIAHGKPLAIDLRATRHDGTTFLCSIAIAPIFGLDGTLELYVATQTDLSERHSEMAKSQQSHRLESLGELTSGVAHEFNNLLSIIEGYATLIRSAMARGEIESEYVAPIIEAARRAALAIAPRLRPAHGARNGYVRPRRLIAPTGTIAAAAARRELSHRASPTRSGRPCARQRADAGAGDSQPRDQCARRHGEWRHNHDRSQRAACQRA